MMDLDSAEEQLQQEQHHFHVLAVDDSLLDRKLLERLLTLSSYQVYNDDVVTCVDSGDKALQYLGLLDHHIQDSNHCQIFPPQQSSSTAISCSSSSKSLDQQQASKVNLIMTDYSMPGMSGYDLLKRIKESSWKDIPVVVMSSENVPSRINMCLEGGAEQFLLKPVKVSDVKKLHSHLLMMNTITSSCDNDGNNNNIDEKTDAAGSNNPGKIKEDVKEIVDSNNCISCLNNNKRKATLTASSSDRSRPRVAQELPVS